MNQSPVARNDTLQRLQKEMLALQGLRPVPVDQRPCLGLGPLEMAFPEKTFPIAAMHEFISHNAENAAATSGFMSGIIGKLMKQETCCIWISNKQHVFPPALKNYGIAPERVIFINPSNSKQVLWTVEEALKCVSLACVVAELSEISFIQSRRLQLAVEQSRVTGFLHRYQPKTTNTIACVARWEINTLPSQVEDDLPGVGFPHWQVNLLKVRNGKPGSWEIEWSGNHFKPLAHPVSHLSKSLIKKTG